MNRIIAYINVLERQSSSFDLNKSKYFLFLIFDSIITTIITLLSYTFPILALYIVSSGEIGKTLLIVIILISLIYSMKHFKIYIDEWKRIKLLKIRNVAYLSVIETFDNIDLETKIKTKFQDDLFYFLSMINSNESDFEKFYLVIPSVLTNVFILLIYFFILYFYSKESAIIYLIIIFLNILVEVIYRKKITNINKEKSNINRKIDYFNKNMKYIDIAYQIRFFSLNSAIKQELQSLKKLMNIELRKEMNIFIRLEIIKYLLLLFFSLFLLKNLNFFSDFGNLSYLAFIICILLNYIDFMNSTVNDILSADSILSNLVEFYSFFDSFKNTEQKSMEHAEIGEDLIKFKDVDYFYDRDSIPILKKVNFSIKQGEKIAIIGENGSGKTTLLHLIIGIFKPKKGNILYNSKLSRFRLSNSQKIGMHFQTSELYPITINENILEKINKENQRKLNILSKKIFINKRVMKLKDNYSSVVSEYLHNIDLSQGEKNRLLLLRVLANDYDILVFDEPTTSLDYEGEKLLNDLLKSEFMDLTVIIVTHRLEYLHEFDKIVYVGTNKLYIGSHLELLENCCDYKNMMDISRKKNLGVQGNVEE